ncbi:hypothetical protein HWV62_5999 [Athelia sp. TMB]|nr:hypothetical protein HWV62_5999 [Athelia sp. TMB]
MSQIATSSPTEDAELASLKRKVAALETQHDMIKGHDLKSADALQTTLGRALRRAVDLFVGPRELVQEADRRIAVLAAGEEPESTAEQEARYKSYMKLIEHVPLIKHLLDEGESDAIQNLYRNLKKGSDNARSDDTSKLKTAVVYWVDSALGTSTPPLRINSKHERGLDNDVTGRLLCPSEYSWEDPIMRNNIREGHADYLVTAHSWPIFLYAGYKCDTNDLEKGLLQSPLLVKAFKYIFTSPSSAAEDLPDIQSDQRPTKRARRAQTTTTRTDVARLIGLNTVTPRAIAYVAVQLRFALSNATAWRLIDIDFSHVEFYAAIVDFFETTPGPRAQASADKLLEWWNKSLDETLEHHKSHSALIVTQVHPWRDWPLSAKLLSTSREV